MVLQQKIAAPVWGWADADENITVQFNGQTKTTKADDKGKWAVALDATDAGGPFTLTVKGKNELKYDNVLVGEVWVGSGQSNMQWNVGNTINVSNETLDFPDIRLITVPCVAKEEPQDNFNGQWTVSTAKTAPGFSAVLYYFGRKLHQELKIPVGLVHCSWGGSSCEAWVNEKILAGNPEYAQIFERRKNFDPKLPSARINHQVGLLYNGMLHPIIGYGIRGVVWYQGETNSGRSYQHRVLFPALIKNWRDEWKQGDFPFYWCQLANFTATNSEPAESGWAEMRESQSMTRSVPHTGEAVIIDIGEAKDIHPRNKQDVGLRLAYLALAQDYGKQIPFESPRYNSVKFDGDKAELKFDFAYNGLYSRGALPTGFQIAGEDKVFYWANAEITGKDTVVVSSPKVAKPVAVRYGWANNPVVTLYNSANLPMNPFRTDDFPGVTINNK
ncbi:9-O-acetylesterase [Planctomycetales bacterium]|nr:9-O-acetylesterase [Planctomycetales bacterium]